MVIKRNKDIRYYMVGIFAASILIFSPNFAAADVIISIVPDNPNCVELGFIGNELKVDPPVDGDYDDVDSNPGPLSVHVEFDPDVDALTVDWTSNINVKGVFVKGANNGNLYTYTPPTNGDTGLETPTQQGISHVSFCYDEMVGGTGIQIDKTAMLLAGAQMNAAWMIPVIVAGIGFAIVIARKF